MDSVPSAGPAGEAPPAAELERGLGRWLILVMAFGTIMGTGMFFGAAIGAKYGGLASLLAWPILLVVCLYIAGCFGELASMLPKAGGIYEFCKQAYGRMPSFFAGFTGWTIVNLANTLCVIAGVQYLLPEESSMVRAGVSIAIIVLLNAITFFGVKESGLMVLGFVAITVVMVIAIVAFGVPRIDPANYQPFALVETLPLLVAVLLLSESFFGWGAVTYMSEETKEPEKNIPRALMLGTLLVGLASMAVHVVAFGVVKWTGLIGSTAPLSLIFSRIFPPSLDIYLRVAIFLTLLGNTTGGMISLPRLLLALSRDKLFLTQQLVGIQQAGRMVPMSMLLYAATIICVPVLRRRHPAAVRPFRVPFGTIGPYLVTLFILVLIGVWVKVDTEAVPLLALGASIVMLGLPLYLLVELYYDQGMIASARDLTAHLSLWTEGLFFPKRIQKEMFVWLGDLRDRVVLEFGCGVGTLTLKLAEAVGPGGEVFATDISLNELKIVKRRLLHEMWRSTDLTHGRVQVLHDPQHMEHVHPGVKYADAAVSFGVMSYIQDVPGVLHELSAVLPEGGKICFVEYVDFFRVLPNPEWLSDNRKIEEMFRSNGFSVRVARKRSFLWNYVYLYGIKSKFDVPVV